MNEGSAAPVGRFVWRYLLGAEHTDHGDPHPRRAWRVLRCLLYNLTTSGWPVFFAAIVDGIVESVEHAHADVAPAEVSPSHGELYGASINDPRQRPDRNPPAELAFFPKRVCIPRLRVSTGASQTRDPFLLPTVKRRTKTNQDSLMVVTVGR